MTNQAVQADPAVEAWSSMIASRLQEAAADEPGELADRRLTAAAAFQKLGFPTGKNELWRHTSLNPIVRTEWTAATPLWDDEITREDVAEAAGIEGIAGTDAHTLVFVNGGYRASLSSYDAPRGITIAPSGNVPAIVETIGDRVTVDEAPFAAINSALFQDAAILEVDANTSLGKPLHIIQISTAQDGPTASQTRALIRVGAGSKATIVESFVTLSKGSDAAKTFTNSVTEFDVAANATVEYIRIQRDTDTGYYIHTLGGQVEEGATLNTYNACLGSPLARVNLRVRLNGEQGHVGMQGLVLAGGDDHVDNHTHLDHALPHCTSHELYKHILDEKAHAVFYGRIVVFQDAQKTDADQGNHTLLLSRDAHIDAMPQLEIHADDVRCTHGATSGPPDGELEFYLRSRGLTPTAATTLLTQGFAGEVIDNFPLEPVREFLTDQLIDRLKHRL